MGVLLALDDGSLLSRGASGRPQRPELPGESDCRAEDHDPALRALDAAHLPGDGRSRALPESAEGDLQRRGVDVGSAAALLRTARGRVAQSLRAHGSSSRRQLLAVQARQRALDCAHRQADLEHAALHSRPVPATGTDRRAWRIAYRRSEPGAGLLEAAGVDGAEVYTRSVRTGAGSAALQDGRPDALSP